MLLSLTLEAHVCVAFHVVTCASAVVQGGPHGELQVTRWPAEQTMFSVGHHFNLKELTDKWWLFGLEYLPDVFPKMNLGCHFKESS